MINTKVEVARIRLERLRLIGGILARSCLYSADVVRLRVVDEDGRTEHERAEALHVARNSTRARQKLDAVCELLAEVHRGLEAQLEIHGRAKLCGALAAVLDRAYALLDIYLYELVHQAGVFPSCGPRCAACCTDVPPVLPVEALRMKQALLRLDDGRIRLQRAVEQARQFQKLLLERLPPSPRVDTSDPAYRRTQLAWRSLGYPCPVLGDDGNCVAYAARPLACRIHIHVEDPAHCEPRSPRFLKAERPPLWGHPREARVELALAGISSLLGLEGVPNLQWGLARTPVDDADEL